MIDAQLRAKGVGGSDIAALVGLDPRRDAFAVYADKLGLVEREEPTARMRMGKRLERVIAEAYGEETGQVIVWSDLTLCHPERTWQVYTVDAYVEIPAIGVLDAKNVSFDQSPLWGDAGTDQVPDWIACQCQWYCSGTGLPWCDVAALFGGYDLRIYRVNRDADIEETLLEVAERFWNQNVLKQVAPPIGHSDVANRYLRQRFPKNVSNIREATPDEINLMLLYKQARAVFTEAQARKIEAENAVKEAIGSSDGLKDPVFGTVSWKFIQPTKGVDWEAVARAIVSDLNDGVFPAKDLPRIEEYAEMHQMIKREGYRRINCPRSWSTMINDE